jgi:hypothetical protein
MPPLQKLVALVPVPDQRVDVPLPQDFAACEHDLGLALPNDFKDLLSTYGVGRFLDYLFAYPLDGHDMNLRRNRLLLEGHSSSRTAHPDWYPYPLYPEADGLMLWGGTYDAHSLCWLAKGEPDEWPVVVWEQRNSRYHLYDGGAVAFITDWLQGRLPAQALPTPATRVAWFEPARKLRQVYVYLEGGTGGFRARALLLRHLFEPVQDRGTSSGEEEEDDQDHFATQQNWRISYEQLSNRSRILIAFPSEDEQAARAMVAKAIPTLGHTISHAQTLSGRRVWES